MLTFALIDGAAFAYVCLSQKGDLTINSAASSASSSEPLVTREQEPIEQQGSQGKVSD
jgi:hypothetical protein